MAKTRLLDIKFLNKVKQLALPMIIQGLATSILNFLDVFMVGSLGDTSIAAVGIANQHYLIFNVIILNLAGGAGIFIAQYWGAGDVKSLRKFQGIALIGNLLIAVLFIGTSLIIPDRVMSLYIKDEAVIQEGVKYLLLVTPAFFFQAISMSYIQALRSTENVKLPMYATFIGITINTALNFCLIFGNFGFPRMGVQGAALATVIARFMEAAVLCLAVYIKKTPAALFLKELFLITKDDIFRFFKIGGPVIIHSGAWVIGTSIYTMIYGRINTESIAAFNIAGSMERIAIMLFLSLSTACSIMLGNKIGAGEEKEAREDAKKFMVLTTITALVCSFIFAVICPLLLDLYNLSATSIEYSRYLLFVIAGVTIGKAANILFTVGILRSGGDTKFFMTIDIIGVWGIGIPLALVGTFLLGWPIHFVVLIVSIEEFFKLTAGFIRFKSGKWVNNLVK